LSRVEGWARCRITRAPVAPANAACTRGVLSPNPPTTPAARPRLYPRQGTLRGPRNSTGRVQDSHVLRGVCKTAMFFAGSGQRRCSRWVSQEHRGRAAPVESIAVVQPPAESIAVVQRPWRASAWCSPRGEHRRGAAPAESISVVQPPRRASPWCSSRAEHQRRAAPANSIAVVQPPRTVSGAPEGPRTSGDAQSRCRGCGRVR
jgi:hypothetical protein